VPSGLLEEERQQPDDDRQDAKAFGEARQDDRQAAIWPAASGLRPMALLDMPARMPMRCRVR